MFHQHFNTPAIGGAIRSYYLASALVESGHSVVMITGFNGPKNTFEEVNGIEVNYLAIPYKNQFSFYARSWAFIKYVIGAIRIASNYKDFDISYGISVPLTVGICTRWIKFRYGIHYVFEVGDLWPDAPIQMGFIRNKIFQYLLFSLEKTIYEHADSIVALSPAIANEVEKKIPGKHIDTIPNMADCEFYQPERKDPAIEMKFQLEGNLVISYIGALGVANGLEYLLNCAEASLENGLPVHFIVCGDGAMAKELRESALRRQLTNVTFIGFVNRTGVKEIMNVTDAVFVSYKDIPILETGCPNKYFDGLAAGKMILVNFGGWIRSEIEEHGCGLFVDPKQTNDFIGKLLQVTASKDTLLKYQMKSRRLAENKYSRRQVSQRFNSIFVKYRS